MVDAAERALMIEQSALHPDISRLREWAQERPDIFGGLWLDNAAAEAGTGPVMMCLATTADPELIMPEIAPLVRDARLVRAMRCRWAYRELDELRGEVMREMDRSPSGTYISVIGVDEPENFLDISLSDTDEPFAQELLDRYGPDRVRVTGVALPCAF